jgi:hypothetical protein
MKDHATASPLPAPRIPIQDWDDGDEVLDTDIAALKDVLAQREAQAAEFHRFKDRLLGRG